MTQNNINTQNESKNQQTKYNIEIVRTSDGLYYIDATSTEGKEFRGLAEYLPYKDAKKVAHEALGVTLPPLKSLTWERIGRSSFATVWQIEGRLVDQPAPRFQLGDRVTMGATMNREQAVTGTVTAYEWHAGLCQFIYTMTGEDGKQHQDFADNMHHEPTDGTKVPVIDASEIGASGDIKITDEGIAIGDRVRHNRSGREATVRAFRAEYIKGEGRDRWLYTLDFGGPALWAFGIDLNGGEFLSDAFTPCLPEPPKEMEVSDPTPSPSPTGAGSGCATTLQTASEITAPTPDSLFVTVSNGIPQDIFTDREVAVSDLRRHVEQTLMGCCGGVVSQQGDGFWMVDFPKTGELSLCEVLPFDPRDPRHREAYEAQRKGLGLPELAA